MIRRFVNLVARKPGSENGAYSLHRLDVAKHLFYPSTAKAEAANAKGQSSSGGGDNKQPEIGSLLRRLPRPIVQFQQVPQTPTWRPLDDMFVLLSPGGGEAGDRILHLHASKENHGDVYDADSGSVISTMPSPTLDGPNRVGVQPITFSITTGRTTDRDGEEKQDSRRLYVMTDSGGQSFQCLDLSQHPHRWQPLPSAPFAVAAAAPAAASCITSFTTVDGGSGSTICVSTVAKGTYCFDTRTNEWQHAGDWVLPFDGRAQYVPELDAWLGFSSRADNDTGHDHQLCASSDLAAAMDARRAPILDHVWEDLALPRDQEKMKLSPSFGECHPKKLKMVTLYPLA
ncbi:unnamed protein product [Miscanthus lutarioriparius]|uniref:Uncharacterized protein n=1 Tax=Miscanthus lutarioriparius TaxID=422564 RepID=A0A811SJF3_9POAL|nr:unnamed protein product [Miscanthus lutarioriparius]